MHDKTFGQLLTQFKSTMFFVNLHAEFAFLDLKVVKKEAEDIAAAIIVIADAKATASAKMLEVSANDSASTTTDPSVTDDTTDPTDTLDADMSTSKRSEDSRHDTIDGLVDVGTLPRSEEVGTDPAIGSVDESF